MPPHMQRGSVEKMDQGTLVWVLMIMIAIAGVWLTILSYVLLSKRRRSTEELVTEIKKVMEDELTKQKLMPLLNEMLETELHKEKKAKIKTIKKKAKKARKVDVSDIAQLMDELEDLVMEAEAQTHSSSVSAANAGNEPPKAAPPA
ncbi:MAG: hypothetical protein QCI38_04895 [Candidatus Thermoplasmatota archaeon]|nr:hypothetical protein [Candidatus Thermoplasmatota archaeon]